MSASPVAPRRGELRILLGAAPGVGKTYAALNEARRRLDRGTDVVVGLVETHGRARTAALLEGLEVLPRKVVVHRGAALSELDVDAMLARAPEVCVVDELAHSCAPGSRHAKRWEDVEELLAAGIDVISTVNIQHLESLGDVVERITGVRQRETIPDAVVRAADQIELVDITPEALRRRMAHGNIYRPEKIDASLANYFRTGNLIALRELALLWVADQVDVALQRYRSQEAISEVWEARERVVVAVTGGPESATVMRRAARIARRAGSADLLCVHVLRSDGLAGTGQRADGPALRRLAEDVGASFHTVVGDDVPAALLEFARTANATQLVLGTSRRSRWARAVDPGIGARTIAASGSIDVHLVTHAEAGAPPRRRLSLPARRHAFGWPAAVLLPVLATVIGVVLRDSVALSTDVVLFFLATVVTAMIGGLAPALVAAVGGGLLLNVFLTPPLYTFTVAEPENAFAIVAMVVVALLVAAVVDRADRRAVQAAQARTEATLLASFARVVLSRSDPLPKLLERVREAFGLEAVALLERTPGAGWEVTACTGANPCTTPRDADADVEIDEGVHLVGTGRSLTAGERATFSAVSGQALLALRNRRMAAQAIDAQRRADSADLRTALLSAVGHDLRTPLTAIKAAAGSLRDPTLRMSTTDRAELLATVEESADRLTGLVDNLLDSSRLAAGGVSPVIAPVGLDEVVAAALASGYVDAGRVVVQVAEDLPDVLADAGLAERVVANIVDNALRHGGEGTVAVRASAYADRVELRVVDAGPGVPPKQRDRLFAPFQRLGDRRAATGVGLGLHVARGFTEAMGGTLDAEDTPGGGLTMVLSLPAAPRPGETGRSAEHADGGARPGAVLT
ncbi:sensor histidine kinase KdpD [Actinomycetospora lutea]|uniref:sensor histidine kinase n=1 Tax=Actinomycetospora lutea TaxID=663604 RepID=UPI00236678F9|nr:sensor histidine kinase KdpD [Actinomycetospora lutea]MDD7942272.1 sensor histidine kinase KdpD [Actinomycetospora lutea]